MTTTYDPFHPQYFVEADLREEMNRVYDLCHGCRLCFKFCSAFPTLFDAVDRHDDQDAARLTTAEQDQVVDECFNCKLCYVNCPYVPGQHEWELDFPRLMLRAEQVLRRTRPPGLGDRVTDEVARPHRPVRAGQHDPRPAGQPGDRAARQPRAPGDGEARGHRQRAGAAPVRPPAVLDLVAGAPPARAPGEARQGSAIVFPTCIVEYQAPEVGRDLVRVYERNGIACDVPDGQVCCGAPWLHRGDVDNFRRQGEKNVKVLADAVRAAEARGEEPAVVVPQPTCSYVLKYDYPDYLGGEDADLVAGHTYDAAEYLMKVHKAEGTELDRDFPGEVPAQVTYHAPCHLRAQNVGLKSRDLMKLTGAKVTVVAECSGIDGTWGYRSAHYEASRKVAGKMAKAIDRAGGDVVAGDCHLANGGIVQETGRTPLHPLSLVARAYGLADD